MEAIEVLPDVKQIPGTREELEDRYREKIAYWDNRAKTLQNGSPWQLSSFQDAAKLLSYERDIMLGIHTIGTEFLRIGKNLLKIYDEGLAAFVPDLPDRYPYRLNFVDYVKSKFGIKSTNAYALMNVYREFEKSNCELKMEYEGFGYSQLVEMLPMSYKDRQKVTAGMTVKQIRELRQVAEKKAVAPPVTVAPVTVEPVEVVEPDEKSEQSIGFRTSGQAEPVCNAESNDSRITYFKNDTERKAFLEKYKTWAKWLTVPQLELEVYRVQFTDGATILAFVYTSRAIEGVHKEYRGRKFLLCKPNEKICLDFYDTAPTYIVQYMSSNKVGAYWRESTETCSRTDEP